MSTPDQPLVLSAEPFAAPTRIDLPDGVTVVQVQRPGVTVADLPALFDAGFAELAQLGPVGPGYARYRGDVTRSFDLTIGFPVAADSASDLPAGVERATFPSGPAQALSHVGPFDGLGGAWDTLLAGRDAPDEVVEIYVSDPSVTAPEQLRTDLVLLLG